MGGITGRFRTAGPVLGGLAALCALAALLSACVADQTGATVQPAVIRVPAEAPRTTGRERVADSDHLKLVASFGGEARAPNVTRLLTDVTDRLVRASDRPDQTYAVTLLDWLPDASLGRIDMMYPDPWPKRRHWKRRFVLQESIARIARVLRGGGEFRFATDWADYAAWTLERLTRAADFAWTAERADDWRMPWPGFAGTRYEAKAKREGRTPCYLTFRRK